MGAKKRTIYHAVIKSHEEYDELVETSTNGGKIAIIDCHLDWCGPCLPMVPNYQSLINSYDNADARFGFYQFPESAMNDEMKEKMNMNIIPKYIVLAEGKIAAEIHGVHYVEIVDALNKFIPEMGDD